MPKKPSEVPLGAYTEWFRRRRTGAHRRSLELERLLYHWAAVHPGQIADVDGFVDGCLALLEQQETGP
jgi:hypothetical protein